MSLEDLGMTNLQHLLLAAACIESRASAQEHGYAAEQPCSDEPEPVDQEKSRSDAEGSAKRLPAQRSTHNELEKHRRAQLKDALEELKAIVPLGRRASKYTSIGVITQASLFIKTLEARAAKCEEMKDKLRRQRRNLECRVALVTPSAQVSAAWNRDELRLGRQRSPATRYQKSGGVEGSSDNDASSDMDDIDVIND